MFFAKFCCTFLAFVGFLAQKTLKMTKSTSIWSAQHPNAGRNIQHLLSCAHFYCKEKCSQMKKNNNKFVLCEDFWIEFTQSCSVALGFYGVHMKRLILAKDSISLNILTYTSIDILALNLAGPTRHKPVLDPLSDHFLENRLYMSPDSHMKLFFKQILHWNNNKKII